MDEEMKNALSEALETFKAGLPKGISEKEYNEKFDAFKTEIEKKFEGIVTEKVLTAKFEEFSRELAKDLEKFKPQSEKEDVFVSKETFEKVQSAFQKSNKGEITVKAAAAFSSTNAGDAAAPLFGRELVPGIQSTPRQANVVLPALLKGRTSARLIEWVNRINEDGGSAFLGEGALKPLKDWDYDLESSTAKKIAVRSKAPTEMLNDFAGFRQELQMMLSLDLMETIEEKLLTGTLSSTEIAGITTVASSYTTTALDDLVDSPNFVDAIRAAMLQMRLLNYKPDVVFINPTEAALLDLIKDKNGNYIKIQVEGVLRTLLVQETTNIPAGYFLLMDTMKWVVKILEDIRIEFGRDDDDFSKNMMTVICEARLHSYYNSIDVGAFIYSDFATIMAVIEKPVGV